jgi:hypothetical protein
MKTRDLWGVVGMFVLTQAAWAYPTLTGPTGQAVVPTAAVAPVGLSVAADWQELEAEHGLPLRAQLSLGSVAEIGAAFDPFSTDAGIDQALGLNGKLQIGQWATGTAALGAQYRNEEFTGGFEQDFMQAYFAWSTQMRPGTLGIADVGLNLGVNWTEVDPDLGNTENGFRIFAGVRVGVTDSIALMGEYQSEDEDLGDADPITAFTVRFQLTPGIAAQVGITNAVGLIASPDHNLFAGLNFSFGMGQE